jgi:hypothetical protein
MAPGPCTASHPSRWDVDIVVSRALARFDHIAKETPLAEAR